MAEPGRRTLSEAPNLQILGVFRDREELEKALDDLQSRGLERSQLSVVGTADTVRSRLGLPVTAPDTPAAQGSAPVDASEERTLNPLVTGLLAALGGMAAAGVAVASGGTLAGAAVAAFVAGGGTGALGVGATRLLQDTVERGYDEQLAGGGILLLIHPRTAGDLTRAREVLARHADRQVEMPPDRTLT